jgi:molybdenum cofactor cytidylyltransferase
VIPAAILLAAGASRRMGRPKPLLDYRGETFLDRQIALYAASCRPVIVVLGYDASAVAAGARRASDALIILNPRPEHGQLSSLRCALAALPADAPAFFFTPVDSPGVAPATLLALVAAFRAAPAPPAFVIPRCDGRRGHPVLASIARAADFLALPEDASARDLVHARPAETLLIDVADPLIHADIDTPEAYAALLAGGRP